MSGSTKCFKTFTGSTTAQLRKMSHVDEVEMAGGFKNVIEMAHVCCAKRTSNGV